MFCAKCGREIHDEAVVCIHCGCLVAGRSLESTEKSWVVAYLLAWFLGVFGIHRFYLGKIASGIAQMLTFGGCLIWSLIDFICLSFNNFKDSEDKKLIGYIKPLGIAGFCLCVFGGLFYLVIIFISALIESM